MVVSAADQFQVPTVEFPDLEVFLSEQEQLNFPDTFPIPPGNGGPLPVVAGLFAEPQTTGNRYDLWLMRTKAYWFNGVCQMPTAGPLSPNGSLGIHSLPQIGGIAQRASAQIARMSAPYGFRMVEWECKRTNEQPDCPTLLPDDENHVLDYAVIDDGPPYVCADTKTKIWEWSGVYRFLIFRPPWPLDGMNPGRTPAHKMSAQDNFIPGSVFKNFFQ